MLKKISILLFLGVFLLSVFADTAEGKCKNKFLNPINDVCWNCIFPFKISGRTVKLANDMSDFAADPVQSRICLCKSGLSVTVGVPVSFWEPARLADTVKDPYCFPSIGINMGSADTGFLGGGHTEKSNATEQDSTFAQAHWYIFAVWDLLDIFMDFPCLASETFDIAYITELDPLWNDDILAALISPEVLLFSNPIAQLACVADSVAANIGFPQDALFWCAGSWGSAYPITGHVNSSNYIQANSLAASRMVFKLGREGLLWDPGVNVCGSVYSPIWNKSNYRIQVSKPVKGSTCEPIGRSSLIWGAMKNPPFGAGENSGDNFAWVMFRKKVCCVGYTP